MITYDDASPKQAQQIHCKRYIHEYEDAHTQKKIYKLLNKGDLI